LIKLIFHKANLQKIYGKDERKKIGVAVLHSTRYDNSKGNRIGPSLFYASELHSEYNKKRAGFETCSLIIY